MKSAPEPHQSQGPRRARLRPTVRTQVTTHIDKCAWKIGAESHERLIGGPAFQLAA